MTENHIDMMNFKKLIQLPLVIVSCISYAQSVDNSSFVSYLTVRSAALDKDSCIFDACEMFLCVTTRNHIVLPDKYLYLHDYDSLIILDEDSAPIGITFKKFKKTSNTVKSILGYNVSSEQEKHDMALIQPASEIYFENNKIAQFLNDEVSARTCIPNDSSDVFVVVILLKVYSNADLIADINRTSKIVGVATGGLGFVTGTVAKRALKATVGKGYSVIASNIIYQLDRGTMTLVNIEKNNNYGIISGKINSNDKDRILTEATMKALSNTEDELLREYANNNVSSKGRPLISKIKEKWKKMQ